jgi:hypothetical protein
MHQLYPGRYDVRNHVTAQYTEVGIVELKYGILYQGADKSLARPTSWCILFDGENISHDASFVI